MPHFVTSINSDVSAQVARSNLLGTPDHLTQRPNDRAGDQPGRQHANQQCQQRRQQNRYRVALKFGLHGLVFSNIGVIDLRTHLLGALLQLLFELLLAPQQVGVFAKFFSEAGDMATDFIEHRLITGITDVSLELFDLSRGLVGLLDSALTSLLRAFARLLQTQARLIHGLEHQPRDLGDLPSLLDKLGTLLALTIFEGVGTIIGKPCLQHVEVIGNARHRPTGHVQRQLFGLGQFNELIEGLTVIIQRRLHTAAA
ncbi:hypothetical protein D3C79_684360 [compost metagenome]